MLYGETEYPRTNKITCIVNRVGSFESYMDINDFNGLEAMGSIEDTVTAFGFKYGPKQDIFYSRHDAWQRSVGYCRLYDEAATVMSMVIDSEPIYFDYDGKRWMIEFWKGQYGMTTGGEVGVYYANRGDLRIPGVFHGTFYNCVRDEDMLKMSFSLMKNGKRLFRRSSKKHWWLTGFLLGEFSQPSELSMSISITLKDAKMKKAFIDGLIKAQYTKSELSLEHNTVNLLFDKPRNVQPYMLLKSLGIEDMVQRRNKQLCELFQSVTEGSSSIEKLASLQKKDRKLFDKVINIGKPKNVYVMHSVLKKYLPPSGKS